MTTDRTIVAPAPSHAVTVAGADRVSFLDAVLSQRLDGLPVGSVRGWLELDPHGAPRAAGTVAVLDDHVLLVVDEAVAADVVERLGGRTFLADASFALDPRGVLAVRGPDAGVGVVVGDVVLLGVDGGVDIVTPEVSRDRQRLAAAGAVEADARALERWRVRAGVPRWGAEVTPPHLPEELGLLATHTHLAKGCYPGQEAVARMWMLGRPRRRLARVVTTGEVAAGWEAGDGRRRVSVTSTADDRALAFVPADATVGDRYEHDGAAVEVLGFVGDGLTVPGHDPAVTRRRDRTG